MRKTGLMAIMFLAFLLMETSAFAMTFVDEEEVMHAYSGRDTGNQLEGTTSATVTDSDGTELLFAVRGSLAKYNALLESANGEKVFLTLPFELADGKWFVKEIHTENPVRTFWLVTTEASIHTDPVFYLIGRYGDTYVTYVTLKDLEGAGLLGHDVRWGIEDGEFVVQGWNRNWNEEGKYELASEIRVFWDEDMQWMGTRRTIGAPVLNAEDTWYYTDEDGADYYLRGICMARSWIGGVVVKADADGGAFCFVYRFDDYPNFPYSIRYGDNFVHPGTKIKSGLLYDGNDDDPSAAALFEGHLRQELRGVKAWRRAAKEKHCGS